MAAWPSGLPTLPLQDGFKESPPSNLLKTQMDKGPAKIRRRTTANTRPLSMHLELTTAQVATFDSFYVTDCKSGSERFDHTHPRTGTACEMRFVGEPSYTPISGELWDVTFQVEVMP